MNPEGTCVEEPRQQMIAAIPDNESERLEILRQARLLDTSPEEEFDILARLASLICETPIAMVTLVDKERQWFKAKIGQENQESSRDFAFCSHTILDREPLVVKDAASDPRFATNPLVTGEPFIRFYAGIPLEPVEGLRIGSLCVIDRVQRELSSSQMDALHLLASQATKHINLRRSQYALQDAVAVGNQVERELRASHGLFHALMDNSPFLAYMKDAEGRMVYYNQRCAERFRVDREAWLGQTDADLWPASVASALRGNDLAVLREWKTLVFEEQVDAPEEASTQWRSYKFPFKDSKGREYVAGLSVDISADKQAQLQLREYQTALEEANEKLRWMAVTDALTGLANRRAFETALDNELALCSRYGQPLTLMIFDVDNFKAINDTFGHNEGDLVLRCLAEVFQKSFRATDFVARYGGEEFAVLLPSTSKQAAAEIAERLRLAVVDCAPNDHEITISTGVATAVGDSWTKAEFVRRADDALYKSKASGKNRVSLN